MRTWLLYFFELYGGQGLSIKDFVPISAYEGAGFLKLAGVSMWLLRTDILRICDQRGMVMNL